MIYRVSKHEPDLGHAGYEYFGSRRAAARRCAELRRQYRQESEDHELTLSYCLIDVEASTPRTKAEVIALLRLWASHNDNG